MSKIRFSTMAAAVLAAAFLFAALPLPSQPLALPPRFISGDGTRVVSHSHEPVRRLRIFRRRGSSCGALRFELHHRDGSRRRHAQAGCAAVSCGRAGDRCRRAEHASRPLHRDRARAGALSVARRSARRRRRRPAAWRVRDSGASGLVEALTAMARLGCRLRRHGMAQCRHRMARRAAWTLGPRVHAVSVPAGRNARVAARSAGRYADAMGCVDRAAPRCGAGRGGRARARRLDGRRCQWVPRMVSEDAVVRGVLPHLRDARDARPAAGTDATSDARWLSTPSEEAQCIPTVDAIASPATLEFSAVSRTLTARTNATSGGTIVLRKDGRILAQQPLPALTIEAPGEGTYRVEVYLDAAPGNPPIPWIVSNPIYLRSDGWGSPSPVVLQPPTITRGIQGGPWHIEKDEGSTAQVRQDNHPTGSGGTYIPSCRWRSHRPIHGARDRSGEGADRPQAPGLCRAGVAADAHIGSSPPTAIGRSLAAIDLP